MNLNSILISILFLTSSLSGCISEDSIDRNFIEDESELYEDEELAVCGDLDGDGELDCPLSGYIPNTMPWWCNSTGIGGHHVDPYYEGMEKLSLIHISEPTRPY